jgi:HemY protein
VLIHLRKLAPRNVQVLRLLVQLYVQQEDWQKLHELLPDLRRRQVLDTEHWQRLAVQVYREQVTHLSSARELELLHDSWEELPLPVQQDDAFVGVYMEQLVRLGAHRQAEQAIVSSLKRHWNETLVDLFGNLSGSDAGGQLTIAESWLEQHPEDPVLLLALGKISIRNELWGRARGYLERSIELHPTPEGWRLLGQVLERMDESQQAADCYRKGIDLLAGGTTLPAPEIEKALALNRSV